jgi:hypothetical protein
MELNKSTSSTLNSDKGSRTRKDEPDSPRRKDRKSLKRVGDYVLGDVLGEGSYGQVREGLYVPQDLADKDASSLGQSASEKLKFGQRVAVKIIRRRLLTRKVRNGQENLKREIACLKRLKHQNVIQLYDTIDDPSMDKIYLVFELANFLSLQDILDLTSHKHGESGDNSASFKVPRVFDHELLHNPIRIRKCPPLRTPSHNTGCSVREAQEPAEPLLPTSRRPDGAATKIPAPTPLSYPACRLCTSPTLDSRSATACTVPRTAPPPLSPPLTRSQVCHCGHRAGLPRAHPLPPSHPPALSRALPPLPSPLPLSHALHSLTPSLAPPLPRAPPPRPPRAPSTATRGGWCTATSSPPTSS